MSQKRKALFAFLSTLLFFGLVEGFLWLINYEGVTETDLQSTAGFPSNSYVHRRDRIFGDWFIQKKEGWHRSNPYLIERGFHDQEFPTQARKNRIFAIGGSTTFGSPFEHKERGFPERLQKKLGRDWEVINAGVAGMDSTAFPKMVRELAKLQGDYLIIYAGNNEIRGALIAECTNPYRIGLERHLYQLRLVQMIGEQYRRARKKTIRFDRLAEKQDTCMYRQLKLILGKKDGNPQQLFRHDLHYQQLIQRFKSNLQQSIAIAKKAGMKVILVKPPINLLSPPDGSFSNPLLSQKNQHIIQEKTTKKDWSGVLSLDASHSRANYEIGMSLVQNNQFTQARKHLRLAVSRDYLSRRITPELQDAIDSLCDSTIDCTDIQKAFDDKMDGAIPDQKLFVDFCHPSFTDGVNTIVEGIHPLLSP